jgi:hypothetical protein
MTTNTLTARKTLALALALALALLLVAPAVPAQAASFDASTKVGDIIEFGGYNWKVLALENGRALVISERVLEYRSFQHGGTAVTRVGWPDCNLRTYLNDDFYNRFSSADRAQIAEVKLANKANQWGGAAGGADTNDKIFLLSIEEVVKYFGDSGQLANKPSGSGVAHIDDQYNEARRARGPSDAATGTVSWQLRSPGIYANFCAIVTSDGRIGMTGTTVAGGGNNGVRPAMWLNGEFDGADGWAQGSAYLPAAQAAGLIPSSFMGADWKKNTSRSDVVEAIVNMVEVALGKSFEAIATEKGWDLSSNPFTDVQNSNRKVTFLLRAGVASDNSTHTFSPNGTFIRAEAAAMVGKIAVAFFDVKESDVRGTSPFSDVPSSHWAAPFVGYAAAAGIAAGSGGKFDPDGGLSNQETIVMVLLTYNYFSK